MTYKSIMYHNFKRNLHQFKTFLFCCILSVSILFSYSTLIFNESLTRSFTNDNLYLLLKMSHVVLSAFSLFFISYTINTYLNYKKREFAVLKLLGSDSSTIRRGMFIENALILCISYLLGCLFGLLFSFAYFILFKYGLNYDEIDFQIGVINFISTLGVFSVIYILESIVGFFLIQKISPLILINKMKVKRNKSYFLLCVLGISAIIFGYMYLHDNLNNPKIAINGKNPYPIFLSATFLGLLLVIYNFDAFYFKFTKLSRNYYYKNILSITQLRNNFSQSKKLMFVLTIMTFLIISLLSTVLSTYINALDTTQKTQPYHLVVSTPYNEGVISSFNENLRTTAKDNIKTYAHYDYIEGKQSFKFNKNDLSEKTLVENVIIISESTYNALSNTKLSVSKDNYFSHLNDLYKNISDAFPYTVSTLYANDYVSELVFQGQSRKPIVNLRFLPSKSFVVVNNDKFESLSKENMKALLVYNFTDWKDANSVIDQMKSNGMLADDITYATALNYFWGYKQETGTRLFIVVFISLLFIVAAASVQKMKLISEKNYYKERYIKLNSIGITKKQMMKALNTEFKIILISPYIVGAFLGYIYTMINSLNTPVFTYFAKDLIIFIILFLLIEWIIYLISFKNYYKALSNDLVK